MLRKFANGAPRSQRPNARTQACCDGATASTVTVFFARRTSLRHILFLCQRTVQCTCTRAGAHAHTHRRTHARTHARGLHIFIWFNKYCIMSWCKRVHLYCVSALRRSAQKFWEIIHIIWVYVCVCVFVCVHDERGQE